MEVVEIIVLVYGHFIKKRVLKNTMNLFTHKEVNHEGSNSCRWIWNTD
jgi:hypothetical protein